MYQRDTYPFQQYCLSISTPMFVQVHGFSYMYAFEVHDGFLGDGNGTGRLLADDNELIADFVYAIKTFCRAKGVWIRIEYKQDIFGDFVSYYFPEFYYNALHKRVLQHLERWSDNRIRLIFKRWYMIVRRRKWKRIYNVLCQTTLPNDCAYIIANKLLNNAN